ncbi:hypothetical protein RvY_12206 [Ramazzottius varieornatus]|uniref:Elongin-A n=1 Tax=Ramazzottius varieornatus TaxID=947166 RepID=A0A1D1VIQ6_RAMVA|nr:hypothetical protein RvY_12206 [Ramazzottius varieornatus]
MSSNSRTDEVERYKLRLERYIAEDEEDKVLKMLDRLTKCDVTLESLTKTGVGKVVAKLKKHEGDIGTRARSLINDWKALTAQMVTAASSSSTSSSKSSSKPAAPASSKNRSVASALSSLSASFHREEREPSSSTSTSRMDLSSSSLPDLEDDPTMMDYLLTPLPSLSTSTINVAEERSKLANQGISGRKTGRLAMYSGKARNRSFAQVPRLFDLCMRVLIDHVDEIEEFGYIPYDVIKPVLESCSSAQLLRLEQFNPYLMEDADELWQKHCDRDFKTGADLEDDYMTYRDMHAGKVIDREERLRNLSDSIAAKKRAREEPVRKTMVMSAEVRPIVKGNRVRMGDASVSGSPLGIKAKLKMSIAPQPPRSRRAGGSSWSSSAPKQAAKAPLMNKALKAFKNQMKR